MPSRVSLAELIDSDVPLRPEGAVAILREVCRQYVAGDLHGIPNATVIRLTPDGAVVVEGPVNRDHDPVTAAATLLTDLLPGFETPTGFKVPGGLRLVIARATRAIDLPPFSGIAEFSETLSRFSAPDLGETVRGLFRAWGARHAVSPESSRGSEVTISDIRRARRATGLSLEVVARACGVPAAGTGVGLPAQLDRRRPRAPGPDRVRSRGRSRHGTRARRGMAADGVDRGDA
jgi:hypothetical protein